MSLVTALSCPVYGHHERGRPGTLADWVVFLARNLRLCKTSKPRKASVLFTARPNEHLLEQRAPPPCSGMATRIIASQRQKEDLTSRAADMSKHRRERHRPSHLASVSYTHLDVYKRQREAQEETGAPQ